MMNSDEISSENVLVTNDDLDGFHSVSLNSEENLEEEKNSDSIATSSSKEHVNATSSLNIGLNSTAISGAIFIILQSLIYFV